MCSGATGHAEVVRVVFHPDQVSYSDLLRLFWENHDPTQGMRQGNDWGTTYRSGVYTYSDEQQRLAETSRDVYQRVLTARGFGAITTEIKPASEFYYAEDYHQQYLHKNPHGYCGLGGTGVSCPRGLDKTTLDKRELWFDHLHIAMLPRNVFHCYSIWWWFQTSEFSIVLYKQNDHYRSIGSWLDMWLDASHVSVSISVRSITVAAVSLFLT